MTVALTALLGSGALAVAAGDRDVDTDIEAQFKKGTTDNPYVPERPPAFKGTVAAKGNSCEAKRKVEVKGIGSDKTSSRGRFKVEAPGVEPGRYRVKVVERKAGRVVCKAAKTKVRVKASQL